MGNSFTKKDCGQSNEETSSDNSTSDSNQKEWTLLASDTIETWKFSSVLYGFEPRIDYTSDIKGRLQPWCTFGRYFSVKYDSIEKVRKFNLFINNSGYTLEKRVCLLLKVKNFCFCFVI